jgi:predicted DNA-binding transcriptional regulator YafY
MNRTERILDLVAFFLGAREPVTPGELRELFPNEYREPTREAGDRKLERDKADLLALGVPLEWVEPSGDEPGGYRVDRRAFFLPDPKMLPEEAAALYAAGAAALGARDLPFARDLEHALRKLAVAGSLDGVPSTEPDAGPSSGRRHLWIVRPGDPARGGKLRVLGDAVARRKRVHLAYSAVPTLGAPAAPAATERDVEPYGLAFRAGAWRLVGYCHLRRAVRVFLIDRIERLRVNEERPNQPDFELPEGFDAGAVAGERPWRWGGEDRQEVVLRFQPGSELLAERAFEGKPEQLSALQGGGARLRLSINWIDGLLPTLLSFGERVWIEAPPGARARAVAVLEEISRRLQHEPAPAEVEPELAPSQPPPVGLPSSPPVAGSSPPPVGPAIGPGSVPPASGSIAGAGSMPPASASQPPRSRRSRSAGPDRPASDPHERLRRLLLIVPAVCRRPGIKLDALAHELGIDTAELRGDIDRLSLVGRPPFSPDDLIDISVDEQERVTVTLDQSLGRPPQLTAMEALALGAAAQEAAPADPVVLTALEKLTGGLPSTARELYAALARRVVAAAPVAPGVQPLLAALRTAAEGRREVSLGYDRDGVPQVRRVHPLAVVEHHGAWYVIARDADKGAERTFRLDRVRDVRETGASFPDPGPLDAARLSRPELFFPTGHEQTLLLRFGPTGAEWARSRFGARVRALRGGGVEVALESSSTRWAVALVLSFVGEAELVAPLEARTALREEVARALARYR